MNGAVNGESPEERSYLWMALPMAVCLHAAFLSWVQPLAVRAPLQTVAIPDLAFWAQTSDESRALYSPVLFALPTPMGFSASMLNQPLQSDPPIKEQAADLNMLQVDQRVSASPARSVFPQDRYQIAGALEALPTAPSLSRADVETTEKAGGLSVRYEGSALFQDRVPQQVAEIPGAGPVPWLAEFHVGLDKDSRVRSVLMETSPARGPSKDVLVRWLYQQRFQPGPPVSGRVAVRWTPLSNGGEP